mgnify:CR=1 FL=1
MTDPTGHRASAADIAAAVRAGDVTAVAVAEAALTRIAGENQRLNAFTDVTAERALAEAAATDRKRAEGADPGPLAGVPYAVKSLFDIAGLPTRAGALINRDRAPAAADATLIRRMTAAGATLTGALNMGEYAYDFTGENLHEGDCRNPHDTGCMPGGSSSGSGAATAGGLVPVTLGSDTNGSLRVPASLCGVFSLKPTYSRLSRAGTFAFVDSLDHVGPMARSARDLALAYDAMQGPDKADHACAARPADPALPGLDQTGGRLRIGVPRGWCAASSGERAERALQTALDGLRENGAAPREVDLDAAEYGRAAAFLISNAESGQFHLDRLRERPQDFDPDTRDRFFAGALLPAAWVVRAQRVRAWWLRAVLTTFGEVDALVVPATPMSAPRLGTRTIDLHGREVPLRPNLGILAQPFSCVGLPVVTVPVFPPGEMPIGVQIVAPPWREARALRIAHQLEQAGVACAHPPEAAARAAQ